MEANRKPSLVHPDECLTVKELLLRHTRGLAPPVNRDLRYDYDDEPDEVGEGDIIHDWSTEMTEVMDALKESKERQKALKAKKELLLLNKPAQPEPAPPAKPNSSES